jgi:hypothetical protein
VRCQIVFTRVNNQVPEGSQVLWMEVKSSFRGREREKNEEAYGTISSWRPERKRMGTSVMEGRKVSDAQT